MVTGRVGGETVPTYDNYDERHELEEVPSAAHELLLFAARERLAVQQPPDDFPGELELGFEQLEASPIPAHAVSGVMVGVVGDADDACCAGE